MPPPEDLGLVSGAQRAGELSEHIQEYWPLLGKPCSGRTFETALKFAQIRADAFEPDTAILAHGDAHALNTLQAPGGGFKLIDPDSLIAERAYDLSTSMGEWTAELLAGDPVDLGRARCALLARFGDVDPESIWQWGMLGRIAYGLQLLHNGDTDLGAACLAVADAWAAAG